MRKALMLMVFFMLFSIEVACNTPDDEKKKIIKDGKNTPSQTTQEENQNSNNISDTKQFIKETNNNNTVTVVSNPTSTEVLINKHFSLPDNYDPQDLVYPDVPFIFSEKTEKRMMRKVAAKALEDLVAGAKQEGIYISGVSAYRSYATQKALFNSYVEKDGLEEAKTYSAVPGTSEHETGLAIDVSGSTGQCAAQDCFANTPEAIWLANHAYEYGFVIRYPKGKEAITGYQYEPWHIRYVGEKIAEEMQKQGETLEEYLDEVPVSQ